MLVRRRIGREREARLLRVVEDDPECGAGAPGQGADPVAQADPVISALSLVRPMVGWEDHERPLWRTEDVGATLRPRAVLHQDELAAVEVDSRTGEDGEDLKREVDVAVEILMEGVPVA